MTAGPTSFPSSVAPLPIRPAVEDFSLLAGREEEYALIEIDEKVP